MRKKFLAMLLAAVMAFSLLSLSACGGGTSESPSPDVTESPSESPEPSESPSPEPTESPEPEIPYAEANGLSFSKEKSYTIPAFTCLTDSNGEPASYDEISITGVVDASYTFGDISVSEADEDGMVQMVIPYHVEFTTTVTDTSLYGGIEWFYAWGCLNAGVFDYYTGTVIPTDGTLHEDDILGNAIDITYQDVTYPIAYTRSQTNDTNHSDWVDVGGGAYELQMTISVDVTYTIRMPEEYDGLCLLLHLTGQTEPSEDKADSSEIGTLLEAMEEAGDDINDFALMRVSDLM